MINHAVACLKTPNMTYATILPQLFSEEQSPKQFESGIITQVNECHYLCIWLSAEAKAIKNFSLFFFLKISIKCGVEMWAYLLTKDPQKSPLEGGPIVASSSTLQLELAYYLL